MGRYDTITTQHTVLSVASRKQLVTNVRTVSQKAGISGVYSVVLFCASVCVEANKLVNMAGENSILYDW
jgi:hypothetical protein